jgi:predicted phosphodiesterase
MPLRVLHLSDIHFSTKFDEEKVFHKDVRDELRNDLRDVVIPQLGTIDKVLIAGDIAFSGDRKEYEDAAKWLEELTSLCGCKPTDLLTVPGNHDIDRKRILPATKLIHRRLRTSSLPEAKRELVELVAQDDGALVDKLTAYQAFASTYGCHFDSPSKPQWSYLLPIGQGLFLKFIGLTTVQVCDADDQKGSLLLGAHQYVFDRTPGVEVVAPIERKRDSLLMLSWLSWIAGLPWFAFSVEICAILPRCKAFKNGKNSSLTMRSGSRTACCCVG